MPGLEDKLREMEERINRLENKLKLSLFEAEKLAGQPKEGPEERLLEMEDLILLMQLEITKIKDKLSQEIDVELTPKVSQSADDRLTRIEEEIANMRSSGMHEEYEKPERPMPVYAEHPAERRHEAERKVHAEKIVPRKKAEEEEETVAVRGSVLEDLQKILKA
ncbi:MAG: hypothetical protein HYW27_01790 [Candidatus Aenigmarchaeota archaeon]|nr:hypothetical protein [Candidatus Aenigmarchaeota archaeon]